MTLQEYFQGKPRGAQIELAKKCGISKTWMSLLVNAREVPSAGLALMIEKHTKGAVTRKVLRPDLFGEIK